MKIEIVKPNSRTYAINDGVFEGQAYKVDDTAGVDIDELLKWSKLECLHHKKEAGSSAAVGICKIKSDGSIHVPFLLRNPFYLKSDRGECPRCLSEFLHEQMEGL